MGLGVRGVGECVPPTPAVCPFPQLCVPPPVLCSPRWQSIPPQCHVPPAGAIASTEVKLKLQEFLLSKTKEPGPGPPNHSLPQHPKCWYVTTPSQPPPPNYSPVPVPASHPPTPIPTPPIPTPPPDSNPPIPTPPPMLNHPPKAVWGSPAVLAGSLLPPAPPQGSPHLVGPEFPPPNWQPGDPPVLQTPPARHLRRPGRLPAPQNRWVPNWARGGHGWHGPGGANWELPWG